MAAAGNVDPDHLGALVEEAFATVPAGCEPVQDTEPQTGVRFDVRDKGLEQVHICLGARGYPTAASGPLRARPVDRHAGRDHEFPPVPADSASSAVSPTRWEAAWPATGTPAS